MEEKHFIFFIRILMVAFAFTAILFIIFPAGIIDLLNRIGTFFGDFERLDSAEKGIWYALSISNMVVITILCFLIQARPSDARGPLFALIAGKSSSSLVSFYMFFYERMAFALIITSIVDGAIAVLLILGYILTSKSSLPR
ncbi:MAG: hypothetical protein QW561_00265 [Candidatus Aenigmatarchaeota archaeon]